MSFKRALEIFLHSPMFPVTIGSGITGVYVYYKETFRYDKMVKVYKRGNILPPMAENDFEYVYFNRHEEEKKIKEILKSEFTNNYYLIDGEVGVGKTRMVIELVRKMMETDGKKQNGAPIYVNVCQGRSFPDTLSKAVNFKFDEHINFHFFFDFLFGIKSFPKKDELNKLLRVLEAIEMSSYKYCCHYNKPVVMVIDNINLLEQQMPGALQRLQDKAKFWSDRNIIKIIFINNNEKISSQLHQNSTGWFRSGNHVTIGDMKKYEALNFLNNKKIWEDLIEGVWYEDEEVNNEGNIKPEESQMIYDLVGGKILDLITFKRDRRKGISYDVISQNLKEKEREKFIPVSRTPQLWKIISLVRDTPKKEILLSKLNKKFNFKKIQLLVDYHIFRYVRTETGIIIKFNSKLLENVVDEMEKLYKKNKLVAKVTNSLTTRKDVLKAI